MPKALSLVPATTALVLIDLQHGIVAMPVQPVPGHEVVTRCASLAEAFRQAGAPVIYVRVLLTEMVAMTVDSPMHDPSAPPPPPVASELVPEAGHRDGDILVTKRQWGAFTGTELDQLLRRRGIQTIVLGGIATNLGVESTARAAIELDYDVVFAEDAMASVSAEAHLFAVETMFPFMGCVRRCEEIKTALGHEAGATPS